MENWYASNICFINNSLKSQMLHFWCKNISAASYLTGQFLLVSFAWCLISPYPLNVITIQGSAYRLISLPNLIKSQGFK